MSDIVFQFGLTAAMWVFVGAALGLGEWGAAGIGAAFGFYFIYFDATHIARWLA